MKKFVGKDLNGESVVAYVPENENLRMKFEEVNQMWHECHKNEIIVVFKNWQGKKSVLVRHKSYLDALKKHWDFKEV